MFPDESLESYKKWISGQRKSSNIRIGDELRRLAAGESAPVVGAVSREKVYSIEAPIAKQTRRQVRNESAVNCRSDTTDPYGIDSGNNRLYA